MIWPFTLLGALLGLLLGRLPGALFGALLGQAIDRRLRLRRLQDLPALLRGRLAEKPHLDERELLFLLLGRLAKSEGAVQESHIQMARAEMQRLRLGANAQREAIAAFGRGKNLQDGLLQRSLTELSSRPQLAEALLRACWRMALADGYLGAHEQRLLLQWGGWMGFAAHKVKALGQDYQPKNLNDPQSRHSDYQRALKLLGVTANSSPAQIKSAWRRQLSRHHPDKLTGHNATPERLREATERTGELHKAYQLIKKQRGF
ncbi:molecular chaperone DjlA [Ventosimonas gracilis]|uniref:Molecular chaperone DjlA n=1 Tax=Ventosimonas gracilis TaxID=1680762 RepID=A0A139SH84_9GAMM|nr:TerB family tellurite resistance protein [Ventosimonas gracilis]KXU33928.1 molecular chaperone DjlA [Ventosimonas gracilis]